MSLPPTDIVQSRSRLEALANFGIIDTIAEPAFDSIVALARDVCRAPVALISFVEADRQWFKAKSGVDICETPLEQSVCAHAIAQGSMLIVPDLTKDDRTRDNTLVTQAPFFRFYAGAVIEAADGEKLGSLCVLDYSPRPQGLTQEQAGILQQLARQVVHLLEMRVSLGTQTEELDRERQRAVRSERAGEMLRRESSRSRMAQEAGQIGLFDVDTETDVIRVSSEFCRVFGLPVRASYPASQVQALMLPEDSHLYSNEASRRGHTASTRVEYRIRRASDGALRWVERRGEFTERSGDRGPTFSGTVQDITDRKMNELRQTALLELGDGLRDSKTLPQAIGIGTRILGENLVASRAVLSTVDLAGEMLKVEGDWTAPGIRSLVGRYPLSGVRKTIERLATGKLCIVPDVAKDEWLADDRDAYEAVALKAQIQIPLMYDGKLVALMSVHSADPRAWSESEAIFAKTVADQVYASVARIRAEEHQVVLNQELSHRMKNTLSMVQAIASQTLKGVADRGAVRSFTDRLIALSKAHDVLLHQNWTEARIVAVVQNVLSLHNEASRLKLEGSDINLGPRAVMSLSMLLHELATNAVKYGAWSNASGVVSLTWKVEGSPDPVFTMQWNEDGGPATEPPQRRGFGSRLISSGLIGTSKSSLSYSSSGLKAEFQAPLSQMTAR